MSTIKDKVEALSIIRVTASFLQGMALLAGDYQRNDLLLKSDRLSALHEWLKDLCSMGDVVEAATEIEAALRRIQDLETQVGSLKEMVRDDDLQARVYIALGVLDDALMLGETATIGGVHTINLAYLADALRGTLLEQEDAHDGEAPSDTEQG